MSFELDHLNQQYQNLEEKIKNCQSNIESYQSEQNNIREENKRIENLADKQVIVQAFLEKHPNVVYDDKSSLNFTVSPDENVHLARTYFGCDDEPPLQELLNEFERYMVLLPYIQKNPNLKGNIVADLWNEEKRTEQYIEFDSDDTITISTKYDCGICDYTKIKDGVVIKYNYYPPLPDGYENRVSNQPSNVTRFDFELKESYELSTNIEKLPQILDNLAERVASVRDEVVKSPLLN